MGYDKEQNWNTNIRIVNAPKLDTWSIPVY